MKKRNRFSILNKKHSGDFISSDTEYPLSKFRLINKGSNYVKSLHLETVKFPSSNNIIKVELDPDGPSGPAGYIAYDTVKINNAPVIKVDLDADSNNDGTIDVNDNNEDKFEEDSPGVIVCVDKKGISKKRDHLIPLKIKLLPEGIKEGTLELMISSGADKVKIWEDKSKTRKAKKYDIATDTIPKTVYVDGIKKGDAVVDLVYKTKDGIEAGRDKVAVSIVDTISFSPCGEAINKIYYVYAWEPVNYDTGPGFPSDATDVILDNLEHHGWNIVERRYSDDVVDDKPGDCTLRNFKRMANGGIVIVDTHGTPNPAVCAQYFTTKKAAEKWLRNTPDSEMSVEPSKEFPGHWYIYTTKKWFRKHWKSRRDRIKGITIFLCCHGAEGGKRSIVCSAGGRVKFGYTHSPTVGAQENDMKKLFARLNGTVYSGRKRTVKKAYDGGKGYDPKFKMFGNPWTTLNPAPLLVGKTGVHDDKGSGLVVFDTFMSWVYSPDSTVEFTSGTGSSRRWFGFKKHKFGVSFDYETAPDAKAEADSCLAEGKNFGGTRKLSGDGKTYGSDKTW